MEADLAQAGLLLRKSGGKSIRDLLRLRRLRRLQLETGLHLPLEDFTLLRNGFSGSSAIAASPWFFWSIRSLRFPGEDLDLARLYRSEQPGDEDVYRERKKACLKSWKRDGMTHGKHDVVLQEPLTDVCLVMQRIESWAYLGGSLMGSNPLPNECSTVIKV